MERFLKLLMAVNGGVGGAGAGGLLAATALQGLGMEGPSTRMPVMVLAVGTGALLGARLGVGLGRGLGPRRRAIDRR